MKNNKGFTLIELLVVISIISLLSTISMASVNSAKSKSRDVKRTSDIRAIRSVLEMAMNEDGTYVVQGVEGVIPNGSFNDLDPTPVAPTPRDGTCTVTNNTYRYNSTNVNGTSCSATTCPSYELEFCLGAAVAGISSGVHCATPGAISNAACNFAD